MTDAQARYFGGIASERTLVPEHDARLGAPFQEWLGQPMTLAGRVAQ